MGAMGPVNSPHKWPVTRKMFPFDDVIMISIIMTQVFVIRLRAEFILWIQCQLRTRRRACITLSKFHENTPALSEGLREEVCWYADDGYYFGFHQFPEDAANDC